MAKRSGPTDSRTRKPGDEINPPSSGKPFDPQYVGSDARGERLEPQPGRREDESGRDRQRRS